MSRAKKVYVNTEKIKRELKSQGMSQKDLADKLPWGDGHNYIGLHRAIHSGSMTEKMLDLICRELDVAPEYFQDLTDGLNLLLDADVKLDYNFHLRQGINLQSAYFDFVRACYINPEKLTNRQLGILLARLTAVFSQFEEDLNAKRI